MSVTLHPNGQLGFHRPLTMLVKRTLAVSNSNSQPVAFKVKTTAPKQYCVRPNSGRIEPGETVEVQVLLQPMKEDPPPGTKCKDKFLVQSVIITTDREVTSLPELWSTMEKEDKASIHEQKIRCSYLPPLEGTPTPENATTNGSSSATNGSANAVGQAAQPPSAEEDESKFATVRPTSSTAAATNGYPSAVSAFSQPTPSSSSSSKPDGTSTPPAGAASSSFETPSSSVITEKAKDLAAGAGALAAGAASAVGLEKVAEKIAPGAAPSSSSPSPSPSTAATSPSVGGGAATATKSDGSELASQLQAAQVEIARLRAQLDQAEKNAAGLRQRGVPSSSGGGEPGTAQAVVEMKGQEGVPLQVVAGLVFGVFVFTWLFF